MHKGDYHTDYSKYYDKEYKEKDLAFEHVKKLKQELRKVEETAQNKKISKKIIVKKQEQSSNCKVEQENKFEQENQVKQENEIKQGDQVKQEYKVEQENQSEEKPIVKKHFRENE